MASLSHKLKTVKVKWGRGRDKRISTAFGKQVLIPVRPRFAGAVRMYGWGTDI
jgi:hypothetical protein